MLIQSVLKALDIIDCLAAEKSPLSVREVALKCNLSRSTAYRLLRSLVDRGYVVSSQESLYELSLKILSLGQEVLERYDLIGISKPYMVQLCQLSGETVHLGVLVDTEMLYIGKVDSPQSIRMYSSIGSRNPLYSTAMGKAVLAFLPVSERNELIKRIHFVPRTSNTITSPSKLLESLEQIRECGYAIDNLEHEEGIRCLGVPLIGYSGEVLGAISISGPAYRLDLEKLAALANHAIQAAREISRLSGYSSKKKEIHRK